MQINLFNVMHCTFNIIEAVRIPPKDKARKTSSLSSRAYSATLDTTLRNSTR